MPQVLIIEDDKDIAMHILSLTIKVRPPIISFSFTFLMSANASLMRAASFSLLGHK
jgi:hypothetical protein